MQLTDQINPWINNWINTECPTSLHTLRDDSGLVFDWQQVDHLLLLSPRHLPGNLLVTPNDLGAPLLLPVHRPTGTRRRTKQTHLSLTVYTCCCCLCVCRL